ncbi:dihydroxyacetone kinase subunit DhaL [Micrococcus sp. TA1]|uniref:dihydroxyacetone kinase subunit DhaL n=1 Tax=Micrococcus sp. TA1 TaxID=681627 RepID=UPI00161095C0|nr:dihydroxyacetone kinase subunit DhaL [Micrococcus sp. TA1]MBB5750365.1 dihydroxyacetone kinase [Micrococcus sp. TA1]
MKKLINNPRSVVVESLSGLVRLNPHLRLLEGTRTVVDAGAAGRGTVAVLSGGGAGHEPAHAGFVGPGMLTGAVSGEVFTSPSVDDVLVGIRAVDSGAGVLLVVKNYTGDRLNFGLAAEIARADGIDVRMVVVADDVALGESVDHAGHRGIAGTVLVHKVAGAAAAAGLGLDAVADAAQRASGGLATMGVALGSCTVPAAGTPSFELGGEEVEWGLGIHGEQGVERSGVSSASETVDRLLTACLAAGRAAEGQPVALLVNNLGGSSAMEVSVVTDAALSWLQARGVTVARAWSGAFLTAMEMPGVSLSVVAVDEDLLGYLDAPVRTAAWPTGSGEINQSPSLAAPVAESAAREGSELSGPGRFILEAVLEALERAEPELTAMDQQVGDGDLGHSLERGARTVREEGAALPARPDRLLRRISALARRSIGGTSGPLYAVFLLKASEALHGIEEPQAGDWARALTRGLEGIQDLGGARPGDRTMLDALAPAAGALADAADQPLATALRASAEAARSGAEATADMAPRMGRSSYAGDRVRGHVDPGAWAVHLWLAAAAQAAATVDATVDVEPSARPS